MTLLLFRSAKHRPLRGSIFASPDNSTYLEVETNSNLPWLQPSFYLSQFKCCCAFPEIMSSNSGDPVKSICLDASTTSLEKKDETFSNSCHGQTMERWVCLPPVSSYLSFFLPYRCSKDSPNLSTPRCPNRQLSSLKEHD